MSSKEKPTHIALFGVFGAGNLGNECTLEAMLYNIRRYLPAADVTCICTGPEETSAKCGIRAYGIRELRLPHSSNRVLGLLLKIFSVIPVEISRWIKVLRKLKHMDMLMMTGTGMLSDFGISPFGLHYDILRWSVAARIRGCKLLFVSVGVGPIRHPLSRLFVQTALRLANYRSYRDEFSKRYLETIGSRSNEDVVSPDLAFSLPRSVITDARERGVGMTVVGVGIITYFGKNAASGAGETIYRDYVAKMDLFVRWLLDHDYGVRLLIGDVTYDRRVREDLRNLLARNGVNYSKDKIADEPAESVGELLRQLAETDLVVASRFHNVLLSLMLGKPVIAISFHEKVDSLMTAMGVEEFRQSIETVDLNRLIEQFITLEQNAQSLKRRVQRKAEACRKTLDEQYSRIFQCLPSEVGTVLTDDAMTEVRFS